jgi:ATP-dependent Lhr-like helicase
MLDTLMAAGEVVWAGVEPLGERDGRVALYLTDHMMRLRAPDSGSRIADSGSRSESIVDYLREHGASFFTEIHQGTGGGFPNETVDALWDLVWKGLITNDTLHALRAYVRPEDRRARRGPPAPFRSRRLVPPTAEGRWSVIETLKATKGAGTEWGTAMAQQLLSRHGIVTRETVASEAVAGGFSAVYEVLKALEDAGRIRRGYFVAGLGAAQFALPPALDLLRSMREVPESPRTVVLAATDPANPYGAILKWPEPSAGPNRQDGRGPTRTVGALLILVDGAAAGYLRRGERELLLFVPEAEPQRSRVTREVARMLLHLAARRGMLISEINGEAAQSHAAARIFVEVGFITTAMGLQARPQPRSQPASGGPHARPLGSLDAAGIGIAATGFGGHEMAEDKSRIENDPTLMGNSRPRQSETSDTERERVRSSNDIDQELERKGVESTRNRGYDEAVNTPRGSARDQDPDRADSDIDRDDIGSV